jgi:hypothetical protein
MKSALPPLPLDAWRPTKETLHLYAQVIGKIRLALAPRRNHWWHASLRATPRGLSTGFIPHKDSGFEIELDLVSHGVEVRTPRGDRAGFELRDGLSVAAFHRRLFDVLKTFEIQPRILAKPYDVPFSDEPFAKDERHAAYDREAVERYGRTLRWVAGVLEEFAGGYEGKTSPVHVFWHAFDIALTRFSGRRAPAQPGMDGVEREAYSHEVASFGFWPGDQEVPAAAFYAYAAPAPEGLAKEPLDPPEAVWNAEEGSARLMLEDVRTSADPRRTLTSFYESVFRAARKRARWSEAEALPSR